MTKVALAIAGIVLLVSAYSYAISQYKYPPVCPVFTRPRW